MRLLKDRIPLVIGDELSLPAVFRSLKENGRFLLQITALFAVVSVIIALLLIPRYESLVTMFPTPQEQPGKIAIWILL